MNHTIRKRLVKPLTIAELAIGLCVLPKFLKKVKVAVPYQGQSFTIARAELTFGRASSRKVMVGEGVARKSITDGVDPNSGRNQAIERALESLDKQLRRPTGRVGHRYEG